MTSLLMRLALNGVRAWTWLYTWRLPPAFRETRRAEIESDLWECECDAAQDHGLGSVFHVLCRLLIGIPDDVGWRLEQAAAAGTITQRSIALSARAAGAALCICALWVIHVDASRKRPTVVAARLAAVFDHDIEEIKRVPLLTAGIAATIAPSMLPQAAAEAVPRVASGHNLPTSPFFTAQNVGQVAPQSTQADRFVAKLLQNRYALSVRSRQLSGAGAQVLESAIEQSRFVLLGEDHGLAQTPEFWAAVCTAAGPQRFHTMAIEEGPLAAAELEGWARRSDGMAQLAAFQEKFPDSINIYDTREEFEVLQQCTRAAGGEFRLWGLNQESIGAGGLILSHVLASRLGHDARPAMQQLLHKNDDAYRKAMQSGSIFDLFMIAADDQELARDAALLQKDSSPEAQSLFASLVEGHEIHQKSPAEYGNARRRERLMKTRFALNYARAASSAAAPPKVLLKFGAYHVYRGLNPVHASGIGNYVAEFAEAQGAQSLHIRLMPVKGSQPFYPRVGQPAQLRPYSYDLQPMFSNLLPSGWTMFDLRPLRQDVNAPGGAISPDVATLIFGYDILVIVREGTPSTEIR